MAADDGGLPGRIGLRREARDSRRRPRHCRPHDSSPGSFDVLG
jgi:hypothetical protein